MRRLIGLLLLSASGCSGFSAPTARQLQSLPLPGPARAAALSRYRIHLSLDSAWLAGEFDGVVLARHGSDDPVQVRIQLFGDLGPKMLDLLATPDHILGYFPQAQEGVDCRLPDEAAPHLLLFVGASLLEKFSAVPPSRVSGLREEGTGCWLRLNPAVAGMKTAIFLDRSGSITKRRCSWMYGAGWEEEWPGPEDLRVTAPGISIRVRILERTSEPSVRPGALTLTIPADVRIVQGSRK